MSEKLWTTKEIIRVLAALHHAYEALPRWARFLLGGWHNALARLGASINQTDESQGCNGKRVWAAVELDVMICTLSNLGITGWNDALAAARYALIGELGEEGLDPEVWASLSDLGAADG